MTKPVSFDPEAFYDDDDLSDGAGFRFASLARGRKDGTLQYTRRGGRTLYRGDWITRWLSGESANVELRQPELMTA